MDKTALMREGQRGAHIPGDTHDLLFTQRLPVADLIGKTCHVLHAQKHVIPAQRAGFITHLADAVVQQRHDRIRTS